MFKKLLKQQSGFTMIELLISVAVFSVIVAIVSGIFITSLRSNRTSVALITANSDGQLALEQMIRMIRKGEGFLVKYNTENYKCIRFTYSGKFITYRWNKVNKKLESNIVPNRPPDCDSTDDSIFNGIISENLKVEYMDFRMRCKNGVQCPITSDDWYSSNTRFPKITIVLRVGAKKIPIISDRAFINLQTSVSPRSDGRY